MLALLPVWGLEEFGRYVATVGTFSWLVLAVMGVEKAALTIVPRTRVLTAQLTRMLLARAATPLLLAAALTALLAPVGATPAMLAAAAAWASGQGLLSVLASTHRLGGHPERDGAAFFCVAVWVVLASGLAVLGVLRPYAYLLTLTAGVAVACAVLALLIPAVRTRPARTRVSRRLSRLTDRRVVLLGLSDLADACSVSALYVVIAAIGRPADSAALYLVVLLSGLLSGLSMLVLRLRQPVTSLRLRGPAGERGQRRASRITGWVTAITGGAAALAAGAVLAAYLLSGAGGVAGVAASGLALGALVAVEMTMYCAVLYAVYLMENTNGAALSATSTAALAGFVATTVTAILTVPVLGALGAVLGLVIGLCAKAGLLRLRIRRGGTRAPLTVPARALPG